MINRRTILAMATAVAMLAAAPAAIAAYDATPYDALLRKYVTIEKDGIARVDYARWSATKADRTALDSHIQASSAEKPSAMPRAEKFAYWANLYNAITLKVILDAYPVKSIRDIKSAAWLDPKAYLGPWRTDRVTIEGRALSLDAIEHEMMRPVFKDPRVHYTVNCASTGCPNLMPRAWTAATLESDLDAAAKSHVNHPRGIDVAPDGTLRVSSIYKWFIADFGGDDSGVLAHVRKYATPELAVKLKTVTKIGEDHYDWTLNQTK